ncbi:MAG TPA: IgGFc-binding protein [Candidatus Kapabacteria bacterium]|nr:IgGFc-binding protein [Candidatus Kapabacteria bacterium]
MFRSFLSRFWMILFVAGSLLAGAASFPRGAIAQAPLPRAGQSFSFGIPDGPYTLADSAGSLNATSLTLTVVSAYSGCGIITSPSGYIQDFSFAPGAPTVIDLPLNLIHLNDLGKTNKGLLVHTTEPVNLVLHDYVQYGGEATQILPDSALDTSYVTFGWGIWDDPSDGEDNLSEFLVTAEQDSTFVTITPSVRTLLNQAGGTPFTVMLNRGECYIVKSDTSDHPSDPSLSGSLVRSTKPVSVISALTCGYVPVAVQACNELMDQLIGKKWWGSHFFVQPLDPNDSGEEIVLTCDHDFSATINAANFSSTNGRLATPFKGVAEIRTFDNLNNPVPVEAHQLTRSYSDCDSDYGDPSLVTILDTSYYADTALWSTPSYFFSHYVPIIVPTADLNRATLDGTPLSQLGVPSSVINGSGYSAIDPPVRAGEHRILSPDPILAISTGFYVADAYSFIAGPAGSPLARDSAGHVVLLQADSATTCSDFNVTASLTPPLDSSEGAIIFTITITYDPSTIHLVEIVPLAALWNASYTVDTVTRGVVIITVFGKTLITGSNFFRLVFEGWRSTAATTVQMSSGGTSICADDTEVLSSQAAIFAVHPSEDTLRREFLAFASNAALCQPLNLTINTDSIILPADGLVLAKIIVTYNPASEQLLGMLPGNLLAGKTITQNIISPGTFVIQLTPPSLLSGSDKLALLQFNPILANPSDTFRVRLYYLRCGDTLTRDILLTFPVSNSDALVALPAVALDSVILCLPRDTTVELSNSGCQPFVLTNVSITGSDWTLLNASGQPLTLPAIIQSKSGLSLRLRFHPQAIGGEQDSLTLTYTYSDSTFTRTIPLFGIGKAPGTLEYANALDFGNASLCSPLDTVLSFTNESCVPAILDSLRITPPFVLLSKLPATVTAGASATLKLEYAPHDLTSDTESAIATFTVNGIRVTDTLLFSGVGTSSGAMQFARNFNFGGVSLCAPLDTGLTFTNKTCDTATIDSIFVSPPFLLIGRLPVTLRAGSSTKLPIGFAPDALSNDTGRAILLLTVNGRQISDTLTFTGAGKPTGSLHYARTLQFPIASLCSPVDTEITFTNLTCVSATIDSISLSPPFEALSQVPIAVDSGGNASIRLRFAPDSITTDTGHAIITLTVNGRLVTDTLTFTGSGTGAGGANLLSTASSGTVILSHTECNSPDTSLFYLFNSGCDTLRFTSGFTILADSAGSWKLIANPTPALPPGDSVKIALVSNDSLPGTYTGRFLTSYLDSNEIQRPFIIRIAETITPSPRTLSLDTTPIDLGTTSPCETRDTAIAYTNTSCMPLIFDAWRMEHYGDGFQLYNINYQPITIPAGATDSLHITFDGSQSGIVYDTVVVIVGTDKDSVRRIPVQSYTPPVDSVNFVVRMPPQLSAGHSFSADVLPDRPVSAGKNLLSVSGRLRFPDNDFEFDSVTAAAGLQLTTAGLWLSNGVKMVDFSVSNAAGILLDPATPIVRLWLEPVLTDTIAYRVQLDSVFLNGGDPQYSNCTLATSGAGASAQLNASCGDSLTIDVMRGQTLFFATLPDPNPAGMAEGDGLSHFIIQGNVNGHAEIELFDELGRSISHQSFSIQAGQTVPCSFDLRAMPSGGYSYTIRFVSNYGTSVKNGSILVMH